MGLLKLGSFFLLLGNGSLPSSLLHEVIVNCLCLHRLESPSDILDTESLSSVVVGGQGDSLPSIVQFFINNFGGVVVSQLTFVNEILADD